MFRPGPTILTALAWSALAAAWLPFIAWSGLMHDDFGRAFAAIASITLVLSAAEALR